MKWIVTMPLLACSFLASAQSQFKDPRDGRQYATVTLDSKTWMAQNIGYNNQYSHFEYLSGNEVYYLGRSVVKKEVCPEGWRVPTLEEWRALGLDKERIQLRPAGYLDSGEFSGFGEKFVYWTSTLGDSLNPYIVVMDSLNQELGVQKASLTTSASCRCIKE